MLLGNIHKDLELQLKTGRISRLNEVNEFGEVEAVVLDGLRQIHQTHLHFCVGQGSG